MLLCVANHCPLAGTAEYFERRKTVVFAEAIYTHWLFGIWKKGLTTEYSILPICPWNQSQLSWTGCCRFSQFTFPLPGGLSNLSLRERQMNFRRRQILKYAALSPQEKYQFRQNIYKREGTASTCCNKNGICIGIPFQTPVSWMKHFLGKDTVLKNERHLTRSGCRVQMRMV